MKILAILLISLGLLGCQGVDHFTARTYVNYKDFTYDSHKDQNLNVHAQFYNDGTPKDVKIDAISVTPQAAINAALEAARLGAESVKVLSDALLKVLATAPKPVPVP